jgi:hypothetical protein
MSRRRSGRHQSGISNSNLWISPDHLAAIEYAESRVRFTRETEARRREEAGETYLDKYRDDSETIYAAQKFHRLEIKRDKYLQERTSVLECLEIRLIPLEVVFSSVPDTF